MLRNSLVVLNGKGGVLKTSLTAQVAGLAALSGWRVLAVDLDQQGNLARDLGYVASSDGGRSLFRAVAFGEPVEVIDDVRERLDVIAGGPELNQLYAHLLLERQTNPTSRFQALANTLATTAHPYDLVIFDSPPTGSIHYELLTCAHFVIVPTAPDQASIDGLATVFRTLVEVRDISNPSIEVLGTVLGPIATSATRLREDTAAQLEAVAGGRVHVFKQVIRFAQAAAVGCRNEGLLVHEYEKAAEEAADSAPAWYALSKEQRRRRKTWSSAATGLAEDYSRLVEEILTRFTSLREAEAAAQR
jgi:chromosome partitioning protein